MDGIWNGGSIRFSGLHSLGEFEGREQIGNLQINLRVKIENLTLSASFHCDMVILYITLMAYSAKILHIFLINHRSTSLNRVQCLWVAFCQPYKIRRKYPISFFVFVRDSIENEDFLYQGWTLWGEGYALVPSKFLDLLKN